MSKGIRNQYSKYGVTNYYTQFGSNYRNPHERRLTLSIKKMTSLFSDLDYSNVLDLACGSGEITLALQKYVQKRPLKISGMDPFTNEAYKMRCSSNKIETFSFEDLANGQIFGRKYSLIICSYAMHLCNKSVLPNLLAQLALITLHLIIISPTKKFQIQNYNWQKINGFVQEKVHVTLYKSINFEMVWEKLDYENEKENENENEKENSDQKEIKTKEKQESKTLKNEKGTKEKEKLLEEDQKPIKQETNKKKVVIEKEKEKEKGKYIQKTKRKISSQKKDKKKKTKSNSNVKKKQKSKFK
ncbi:protein restricted tev movement 2 [Anaeramoeba flamelloides]|uniref:Protein restricted tev movement 2 n=1 Tax=Anaeramoeba flamelloides TaxID=1746091 RepID=A0ABQ8YMP6_9EUKA|nr:protein restricted tev movement 2 [Anaeramoeba flamelloides]